MIEPSQTQQMIADGFRQIVVHVAGIYRHRPASRWVQKTLIINKNINSINVEYLKT